MKNILFIILTLLFAATAWADKPQNEFAAIDKKALAIPTTETGTTQHIANYINTNFSSQTEKARAAFIWTASTFTYDVENMYAINFHETPEEKINRVMKSHKGICENYAAVFNDICIKCGLRSFMVSGYTKQNGTASYLPHAWCATMIDNDWFLFDPTWGSGFVSGNKFVPKINNYFFKTMPGDLISSHIPFDPLWELLYYPITNQEFYEGNTTIDKSKPYFSFPDSINAYEKLSETNQWIAAARRIEQNGIKNGIIYDRLSNLKQAIEINRQTEEMNQHNSKINTYNDAVAEYNTGVNELNDFIKYRNAQFTPKKTDAEIQAMLDTPDHKITRAKAKVNGITGDNPGSLSTMISSMQKMTADAMVVVEEQKDFLKKYFSKGKLGRKTMFTKYTWMGIPLN